MQYTATKNVNRHIPGHVCNLFCLETNYILTDFIVTGLFVKLRRRLRKLFVVCETNPVSKNFFKSTAQIHQEQWRHLYSYYYMIHPFSEFRIFWESVMIIVYLLLLIIFIPLELCFLVDTPVYIMYPTLVLDVVCYVDIILNFFTGYVDKDRQDVQLHPKRVIQKYLCGLFLVDLLSSLPVTFVLYLTDRFDLFYLKALLFLNVLRMPTLFTLIRNFCSRRRFWSYTMKVFRMSTWFLLAIFWFTGVTVFVLSCYIGPQIDLTTMSLAYVTLYIVDMCTRIIDCLMLVGPDPLPISAPWQEKIMPIFYILLGSVVNMMILSQILRIYKSRNTARNKHQKLKQEIGQFSVYRQIPPELKDKMVRYVDFKYQRKILKETEIMKTLSEILREEIMLFKCQNLVERVDFFSGLPSELLMKIVGKLRPEVYLKDDTIFYAGSQATTMYFIYVGTVVMYSDTGREMMYFGEGKHFGEASLLNGSPRLYTAMARTDCELLRLKRNDFLEVLKPYPKISANLASLGLAKYQKLQGTLGRKSFQGNSLIGD